SFVFYEPPPTELSTLSLHDALPISVPRPRPRRGGGEGPRHARPRHRPLARRRARPHTRCADRPPDGARARGSRPRHGPPGLRRRSEEHTSELQSRENLVCRLLLEKK